MSKGSKQSGIVVSAKWGRWFFFLLLLFLAYIIFLFSQLLAKGDVPSYQVRSGSLALSNKFRGVVLRDEEVVNGSDTGYIAYFAREGEHLSVGDMVYAIDETGSLSELTAGNDSGESALSDSELTELRGQIMDFSADFTPESFYKSYDFLYSLNGSLLRLANASMMNSLNEIGGNYTAELVKLSYTQRSGYVIYHIDGMESLSVNGITPELFDEAAYEKTQLGNHALVDAGAPVYKLLTGEDWSVVIPVEPERAMKLKEEGYVRVRFLKNRQELWAAVSLFPYSDEITYCVLDFNTSVVNFCTDRFLEIELVESNESGLKIPLSSIVHKEFFLVPKTYVVEELEDHHCIFLRKTFLEDGSVEARRLEIEVYAADDENYYVDDSQLRIGDYLLRQGDQAEFPVSQKGELVGVYNINKGYADFRQINILYQNDEYAIVKSNTVYGLSEYDYIALDASALTDDSFVFE
ncbi:MAG: hypothetical protein IK115_01265 [Lachnospiraceae bacterium]|nr:hypothetical protein [Lachnospiraceae bacterium]